MTKQPMVKWRLLKDGNWGVFGPESVVKKGATVKVTKSSGDSSLETVGEIVGSFDKDGEKYVFATIMHLAYECIECGERLYTESQKRSGYCRPDCG